jgi:hypothetical protein
MAKNVYEVGLIENISGEIIEISPLKIKYMKPFMDKFDTLKENDNNEESIDILIECVLIAMHQFRPDKYITKEDVESDFDIKTLYSILEYCAEVKIKDSQEKEKSSTSSDENSGWASLDLPKLEAEVFMTGIWKNFEELEESISIPELLLILSTKRDLDYEEKKFNAALQGVDLDKQSNKSNAWEEMKARVFSKGKADSANDILALQGVNAQKAGFGIGMGLDYEDLR